MKPTPTFLREATIITLLSLILILGSCLYLHAQLTVEGKITGTTNGLSIDLIDADGYPSPIKIKGKGKRARYSFTIESRNATYLLRVRRKGYGTRYLHIFTHQPDSSIVKWYEQIHIPAELPNESVLYWSPSQANYIRAHTITTEDANRLSDLKLWPTRIHPTIIQEL